MTREEAKEVVRMIVLGTSTVEHAESLVMKRVDALLLAEREKCAAACVRRADEWKELAKKLCEFSQAAADAHAFSLEALRCADYVRSPETKIASADT